MVADNIIDDINAILKRHGIKTEITRSQLTVTDCTVSDLYMQDAVLSNAIIDKLWPSIRCETVYHYTSLDSAENILESRNFRLNNIGNRYDEGEIISFCSSHNLDGYLEKDSLGDPKYKQLLMPNTYYASFTGTQLTEEQDNYLFDAFSKGSEGARIKFKITAQNSNFRKIYYETSKGEPIPLLKELMCCVENKYKRKFVLKGLSHICSFYLSGELFKNENECRILHRVWDNTSCSEKYGNELPFIALPLEEMAESGFQLDLIEVQAHHFPKHIGNYTFVQR